MLSKTITAPTELNNLLSDLTFNELALIKCILIKKLKNRDDKEFCISQEDFIQLGFPVDEAVEAITSSCDVLFNRIVDIDLKIHGIAVANLQFHWINTVHYVKKGFQQTVKKNYPLLPTAIQETVDRYRLSSLVNNLFDSDDNIIAYIVINDNIVPYLNDFIDYNLEKSRNIIDEVI